jgi:hypothetical protein
MVALALAPLIAACSASPSGSNASPDAGLWPRLDGLPDAPVREARAMPPGTLKDIKPVGGKITFSLPTDGYDERYALLLLPNGTDPAGQLGHSEIEIKAGQDPTRSHAPRSRLDPRLGGAGGLPAAPPRPSPPPMPSPDPPEVGDKQTFKITNASKNGFWTIKAEVLHVDDTAVWWFNGDSQHPSPWSAGLTPELLDQLSQGLHQVLMPRLRRYFGHEPDVDQDGRVAVLFTPAIRWDEAGRADPCDVLPNPDARPGCGHGNRTDLVALPLPATRAGFKGEATALLGAVAHELVRLIHFHRRVVVNGMGPKTDPNPFLVEGLGLLAQDLTGYQQMGLFKVAAAMRWGDFLSIYKILDPSRPVPIPGSNDDDPLSGSAYLMLRYLFERSGGDKLDKKGMPSPDAGGVKWLGGVMASQEVAAKAILAGMALDETELAHSLWTAMVVTNYRDAAGKPLVSDPRYSYARVVADPLTGRPRGCLIREPWGMTYIDGPKTDWLPFDGLVQNGGFKVVYFRGSDAWPWIDVSLDVDTSEMLARLVRLE